MLTTADLYEKPGYAFDVGDVVRFELLRGLELRIRDSYGARGFVEKSQNPNSNRKVIGTIMDYKPWKPGDLEIECITNDGTEVMLHLNQCRNLKILEPKHN